jgi:hypothetical protein
MAEKISVEVCEPKDLTKADWLVHQTLSREAFGVIMQGFRSENEIDFFVNTDNPDQYYESHLDPSYQEDGRRNNNNAYANLRVARAFIDGRLAGWGYAGDNVSGSNSLIRAAKMRTIDKRYLWTREIITDKEFMRQGVAIEVERALLLDGDPRQPVAGYFTPDEEPEFITKTAIKQGFEEAGFQDRLLFGPNARPTKLVRRVAPTVASVRFLL